ncbi:hypothetical protein DFP72DRAFT_491137 [Ephemerocybe angulata]|uniref:Uncharacterized protein n=1 Tax=Ephemerocybe angulata TaxID=980116 RepID=A0A8H6IHR5_9AGAR|nr:hypothetical protein DFP72DRAFT_491137 [Tulosesus angulatus]
MAGTRWVLVDDKDAGISYSGSWFENSDGFTVGNWGSPWGGSQHGLNGTGSFSYTFSGTRIRVLGTSAVQSSSSGTDPSWKCMVGDSDIPTSNPWTTQINNWPLCESPEFVPGQHTFTLNTVSQKATFWFDQIRYLPLSNMNSTLTGAVSVVVEHSDPAVTYTSGSWQDLTTNAKVTSQAGSAMTIKFTGTKLTWVGWTPIGYPTGTSQGTYSIDDGPATTFEIKGSESDTSNLYNQLLFETPVLSPGKEHTLTVTHNGPSAPLTIDYVIIANGDIILPDGGSSSSEGLDASSAAGAKSGSKPPLPLIIGASVGGVAFILLCIFGYILFIRWRRRRQTLKRLDPSTMAHLPPPIAQITPFTYTNRNNSAMYMSSQTNLTQASQTPAGWSPPTTTTNRLCCARGEQAFLTNLTIHSSETGPEEPQLVTRSIPSLSNRSVPTLHPHPTATSAPLRTPHQAFARVRNRGPSLLHRPAGKCIMRTVGFASPLPSLHPSTFCHRLRIRLHDRRYRRNRPVFKIPYHSFAPPTLAVFISL